MNKKSKRPRVVKPFIIIFYILLVLAPWVYLYRSGLPQGYKGVEPEIVNGLLTGSSILFGFAVLPLGKKKIDDVLWLMIVGDLFILAICGLAIFQFAIGHNDGLLPLLLTTTSLNANTITSFYRHGLSGE